MIGRKILAIDPGLSLGWSVLEVDLLMSRLRDPVALGTFKIKGSDGERDSMLRSFLEESIAVHSPVAIAWEQVDSHRGVRAAHVYGGITLAIAGACHQFDLKPIKVPVKTWKKSGPGNGNATPEEYTWIARRRLRIAELTEDEAAAWWIGTCAVKMLCIEEGLV